MMYQIIYFYYSFYQFLDYLFLFMENDMFFSTHRMSRLPLLAERRRKNRVTSLTAHLFDHRAVVYRAVKSHRTCLLM